MKLALVLVRTPADAAGRAGVRALRAAQAQALARSASRAGAPAPREFPRDGAGAPLAFRGAADGDPWHWSAANTRGAAVGAVARAALGVDVESLARPRVAPVEAFADASERSLASIWDVPRRLALWTAKEAVLKKAGCGIAELRICRLRAAFGFDPSTAARGELVLEHRGRLHRVVLLVEGAFLVALACDAESFAAELAVESAPASLEALA